MIPARYAIKQWKERLRNGPETISTVKNVSREIIQEMVDYFEVTNTYVENLIKNFEFFGFLENLAPKNSG